LRTNDGSMEKQCKYSVFATAHARSTRTTMLLLAAQGQQLQ
jgi:hypothetical protein